ncbi:COG1086 Predicted nucleoside-diphosphate sugar epimerases [Rhabdaerophilaceae bacterium]
MLLLSRPRATKLLIIVHDLAMTLLAAILSLGLRFDTTQFAERTTQLLPVLPIFLGAALWIYSFFQLYQGKWRFASMPDVITIAKAVGLMCLVMVLAEFIALHLILNGEYLLGRRAIITYWLVQSFLLAAPRLIYRYWKDRYRSPSAMTEASAVLLLGRGVEVEPIIRVLESDKKAQLRPVGVLSPRAADIGQAIRGVPVEGTLDALEDVVRGNKVAGRPIRRLIATPSALQHDPERLAARVRQLGLVLARFDGLNATGPALGSIEIEDLLSRPPVDLDPVLLAKAIQGRVVVVTGGGGSIGLDLCRSCLRFGAKKLVILENSEPAIYHALDTLTPTGSDPRVIAHLCDIRDGARLMALLQDIKPDVIFHAAALKHVPYLETDWEEGLSTNTHGSMAVAEAAIAVEARILVMISTDKAVEPVSILGASKRAAEIAMEALDAVQAKSGGKTRLISVRFGNVLGSSGSVIPRFKAQIARGGPITVTDPEMIRYFMTLSEAADLVVIAAAHALDEHGDGRAAVYVLRMGKPVRILDLAERMIRLSGFEPNKDIKIEISGIRPGERLNEMLFSDHESLKEIGIDGVMAARTQALPLAEVRVWLTRLQEATSRRDRIATMAILQEHIPDFKPGVSAPPLPAKPASPAAVAPSPTKAALLAPQSEMKTAGRHAAKARKT